MNENTGRSWISVEGRNKFTYGFIMGDTEAQQQLRSMAKDVIIIQLSGPEKAATLQQFRHLPYSPADTGPLTYYGDTAKFVARHLSLTV